MNDQKIKKVFISYSWSNSEHEKQVVEWAKKLMADGIDVVLDKWDLKEGHDKFSFMEQMVLDETIDKVIIICDKTYTEKANKKEGGVGTESQIISKEVYEKVQQDKFIPIITEVNEKGIPYIPIFLKNRIYIDFSSAENFFSEYEKLLRNIYNKPLHNKPILGKIPEYIKNDLPVNLKTINSFQNFLNAITKNQPNRVSLSKDYLEDFLSNLRDFQIDSSINELDDKVFESIKMMKPYRDQFIHYLKTICSHHTTEDYFSDIHDFLGNLMEYSGPLKNMGSYYPAQFDNYRFFMREIFLYLITILIDYKKADEINFFFAEKYFYNSINGMSDFTFDSFDFYSQILDRVRNQRLGLQRISVTADIIHDNADIHGIGIEKLMQTDFILCVRGLLDGRHRTWFPRLMVFNRRGSSYEIFYKAQSERNFALLAKILNVSSRADFASRWQKIKETKELHRYSIDYWSVDFDSLMNTDKIFV